MAIYCNLADLGDNVLQHNDAVIFEIPETVAGDDVTHTVKVIYTVKDPEPPYLDNPCGDNRVIFARLGFEELRHKIANSIVGKPNKSDPMRGWPTAAGWDLADQTKIVKALFQHIAGLVDLMAEERAAEAKAAAEFQDIIDKNPNLPAVVNALTAGKWGCQESNVYDLMAALLSMSRPQLDAVIVVSTR
jgi:hypothetical protein